MNQNYFNYKVSFFLIFLSLCSFFSSGQTASCDTTLFYDLRDLQIKQADLLFKKVYVLKRETFPFDITEAGSVKADTTFHEVCTDVFYWSDRPFSSPNVRLANAGETKLFVYCTISTPVINKRKKRFKIQMLSFFGNWGSKGETYYFKKRFGKWKMYKKNLIFSN